VIPRWVFLQELHEPSNVKALAKAKSSQETLPLIEGIAESTKIMKIHLDWHTPFMVHLRTGGLSKDKVECERLCQWAGQ
jgi:hypothetical protein